MKKLLAAALLSLSCLTSCVFDVPFVERAEIPVDAALLGHWKGISDSGTDDTNTMLVLQNGENDYMIQFPTGKKAMFFRAFAVDLGGKTYFQTQLLGTAEGPAKVADRKFQLFKLGRDGDSLTLQSLNAKILGKGLTDTAKLKAAFLAHQDDPTLFADSIPFRRGK